MMRSTADRSPSSHVGAEQHGHHERPADHGHRERQLVERLERELDRDDGPVGGGDQGAAGERGAKRKRGSHDTPDRGRRGRARSIAPGLSAILTTMPVSPA
jgi:hypothetical protein